MSPEKKACSVIRGCLVDAALYSVLAEKRFVVKVAHHVYEKNMYNKLMLKRRLYSLWMQEGWDILGHIQKFDQTCNKLLNIGIKMKEEDKSLLLLCSLPSSYDPLVTTLLYGKETLEYEDMVSMLRTNEQWERLTKKDIPQEGLTMGERSERSKKRGKSRGCSKSRKSKNKKEAKCYKCNEIGHFIHDCSQLKNKKRRKEWI